MFGRKKGWVGQYGGGKGRLDDGIVYIFLPPQRQHILDV
jgi:hypothetical protein